MPDLRDTVPSVRHAMGRRSLPSTGPRSARRDVALVADWLRSLTSVDAPASATAAQDSDRTSGPAQACVRP